MNVKGKIGTHQQVTRKEFECYFGVLWGLLGNHPNLTEVLGSTNNSGHYVWL